MSQLLKFGLILGVICFIATVVLALTYEMTRPRIEAQLKAEEDAALKSVMPRADTFEAKKTDGIEYYGAFKGGRLEGYCIKAVGNGYSGYIRMIVGIEPSGVITGVRILEQYETPGLGSQIVEVKKGQVEPRFLSQFKGKNALAVEVKKNIDAITGATITSKAVTDAVRNTVTEFLEKVKK